MALIDTTKIIYRPLLGHWVVDKEQIESMPSAEQRITCSECRHCDDEMFCHAFEGLGRRVTADEYCSSAEPKGEQEDG